ncbi:hypothetical protein FRACYDRAFT_244417 [Fragilariopsis cylindrus CCMP1102]|uniref:Fe2OG dioxygenase domain-containing protein n=1 Tax=Fragilariopsis cylindrus CCMP1102 TaxID=635003 RepID=A0A1E7F218_9STRA|nr:hypothetical protein FRACYDRAFT_244417 [Fragilariopsis cylindrus CCMP1102]|eukprot:OEU12156.1 hypothetical protein FRACYDRAFT_244417 [Fragilariopsis cylindrus CCMP1102]
MRVSFFFFILLLRINKDDSANAFSTKSPSSSLPSTIGAPVNNSNHNNHNLLSSEDINKIALGGVAVIANFVPSDLINRMRKDAISLQKNGHFRADGLSNKALGSRNDIQKQGFTSNGDRQTFRGTSTSTSDAGGGGGGTNNNGIISWYNTEIGDYKTRKEFDQLMCQLRTQLSIDLNRPTLISDEQQQQQQQQQQKGSSRHEITYNWYEPTAKLGQHLDEHHEETKGPQGWKYPTRRSITWLVYLNDAWTDEEGGALRCLPRKNQNINNNANANANNNSNNNNNNNNRNYGPVGSHEGNIQIGWMDGYNPVYLDAFRDSGQTAFNTEELYIIPFGGTIVLFDSVTLPHSVLEVTGKRQRIAATGWFHEDSQFTF